MKSFTKTILQTITKSSVDKKNANSKDNVESQETTSLDVVTEIIKNKNELQSKEGILRLATKFFDKDKDGNLLNEAVSFLKKNLKK